MGPHQNKVMKEATIYRDDYEALKHLRMEVHDVFIEKMPKGLVFRAGRDLKVLKGKQLSLTVESDISLLSDFMLYNYPPSLRFMDQSLIATLIAAEKAPEDPLKADLYHGMSHARFSLFRLTETVEGDGCWLYDLLRHEYIFVHDHALSFMQETNFTFACNILPLPNLFITSGMVIPFFTNEMIQVGGASLKKLQQKDGSLNLSPHAMVSFAKMIYQKAFLYGIMEHVRLH